VFGGTLPSERSPLRANRFPEPTAYRQQRELAEQAHALASEVGLRQAARQLGIHRDALAAAFTAWGLPAQERRVGWQPSRFLTDRAEAQRAFALGATWPSLRKAFHRHGLGCRHATPRPSASGRSRRPASAAGSQPRQAWTRCLWRSTRGSCPSGRARVGSWPSGCAGLRTTRCSMGGWWWSCTQKATGPGPAPVPGRSPAAASAPIAAHHDRQQRGERRQADPAGRTDRLQQPPGEGWLLIPTDPIRPGEPATPTDSLELILR
jgi:hypothetical protein